MRLLLDECVPARLRRALLSHQVSTVVIEGWSGIKNGKLLALAAVASFGAFIAEPFATCRRECRCPPDIFRVRAH